MSLERIEITTNDGLMPAAMAAPHGHASGTRGAIVVVQEAFGLTDHLQDTCTRLADAGWLAIAPALFHREGSPVFAYDDFAGLLPVMQTLTAEGIDTDLDATFGYLASHGYGPERCGIVGFCMGGTVSLYAATRRPLGAAVTFYGGGVAAGRFGFPSLVEITPTLRGPWLGLYGDLDKGIPFTDVELLRDAASLADAPTEVVRYADADHGFNNNDRPTAFNAAAADDAWQRTLNWFDQFIAQS